MPEAECFMYFIAGLGQVLEFGSTLYIEGTDFDPEIEAFYREHAAPEITQVMPLLRHPRRRAYHLVWGRQEHATLARFASSKTYAQVGLAMLSYREQEIRMDASRLGERRVLFSESLSESQLKKFCAGKLHGSYRWVEKERGSTN
jgi:hypothetical protein